MKTWKDILGSPPNDGDIVTVRRIPTDALAFTRSRDNRRFFVTGARFWIDWWTACRWNVYR
jgi:hypothetical protein